MSLLPKTAGQHGVCRPLHRSLVFPLLRCIFLAADIHGTLIVLWVVGRVHRALLGVFFWGCAVLHCSPVWVL